jgi:hypothetical protein
MQEPVIETLGRGDNPLFKEVVGVAQELGAGNDLAQLMEFLEKGEKIFGRFVPLLEKAGNTILKLQRAHANGGMVDLDPEPMGDLGPGRVVDASPPAPPVPQRQITPIMVYGKLLGIMAHVPQDMTIGKALADAREKKALLLQIIAGELDQMMAGGDDADQPGE